MNQPCKPLIYLAGPITKPDPNVNTHEAIALADHLMSVWPITLFVPHLSVLWQLVSPKEHAAWLEYDFGVIQHCDAMLRIPGQSVGAEMEEHWADALSIPVFPLSKYGAPPYDFQNWLEQWRPQVKPAWTDPQTAQAIAAWGAGQH